METIHVVLLVGGGFVAGIINTMAGGGSLLTVPLLVFADVPGNTANGSNRVGVLTGALSAAGTFRRLGVAGFSGVGRILGPAVVGSLIGSMIVSRLADDTFERVFGVMMIPILILSLRRPDTERLAARPQWPLWLTTLVFFVIGVYGGAFQAGVGLMLILALSRAGIDIVVANNIKVITTFVFTAFALPVFIINGDAVGSSISKRPTAQAGHRLRGWWQCSLVPRGCYQDAGPLRSRPPRLYGRGCGSRY